MNVRSVVRTTLPALLVLALAGACAQPGQLGHEADEPAAAPPAPPAQTTQLAEGPASAPDARGRLPEKIEISTQGAADVLIRTETLAPGQGTGWISHPGTVLSVVRSGTVTVTQGPACAPVPVGPEQSFFVPDGASYEMRNDGAEPVVLTRSEVLAPDFDERRPVAPAC